VTSAEYRQAMDALPFGKRLPGAVYLIDPGEDSRIPSLLRITVAELRKRLEIGPEFNLLKFHTASPEISFLAYPDFEKDPHPALKEAVIVDLVTGKTRAPAPVFQRTLPRQGPPGPLENGPLQLQVPQARTARGNHRLRAVEGKVGGVEPRAAGKLTTDLALARVSPSSP